MFFQMNVYTLQLNDEGRYQLNNAGNCISFLNQWMEKMCAIFHGTNCSIKGMGKIIVVDLIDMASPIVLTGTVDECPSQQLFCSAYQGSLCTDAWNQ